MSDLASLILLLVLALLVIGALRLDLLGQLWREWLKLGEQPPAVADWHEDHAHGPYLARHQRLQRGDLAHHRPPFHRSGRRG
jgi:hypothetical protein